MRTSKIEPATLRTSILALVVMLETLSLGCARPDPAAEPVSKALEAPHPSPTGQRASPTLPDDAMRMVRIPGGSFRMHDIELHAGAEVAVHPPSIVTVASFELDATEVTADAYLTCVKNGACGALGPNFSTNPACTATRPGAGLRPMECLTWFEATAYCRTQGKRLPSEREWEYAARGGARNTAYPWGDEDPEGPPVRLCWTGSGAWRSETCRVASFPAEAFGTYDLAGNVAEWTSTVEDSAYFDDKNSKPHSYRVVRGGQSGTNVPRGIMLHSLERTDYNSAGVGVRCARDYSPNAVDAAGR